MALDETTKKRCDEVFALGLTLHFGENAYIKDDFYVPIQDIQFDSDEKWNERMSKIREEVKRRKNL